MRSRRASMLALALSLALVTTHAQEPDKPLVFTRATLVASAVEGPQFFHDLIFEDDALRIVGRHYGPGGKYTPGLFVHRKADDKWLQILGLSTEHARLGRSPSISDTPRPASSLPVSWNYGYLVDRPYAPVPRTGGSFLAFPDRIVPTPSQRAYRLDFNSQLEFEVSLTWFWVKYDDLEAGRGAAIALEPSVRVPVVAATVMLQDGRQLNTRLAISTGTARGAVLFSSFASRNKLATVGSGRSKAIRIGDVALRDFPLAIGEEAGDRATADACGCDGLIGNGLLRRFRATFDQSRRRLYLEAGALRDVPYEYDLVGAKAVVNGNSVAIADVYWNTPAQKADLQPGDIIDEIDGRRADQGNVDDVRLALAQRGAHVLSIRRLGKPLTLTIQTPELPDLR